MAAVYELKMLMNGRSYYGSSAHPLGRIGDHLRMLGKNEHPCGDLQRDYNEAGRVPSAITFRVLRIFPGVDAARKHEIEVLKADAGSYNKSIVMGPSSLDSRLARRAMIRKLKSDGLTYREIATVVGCALGTISKDLRDL
jgi:hypothetical protein